MQISVYITEADFAELAKNLPQGKKSVSQYVAELIRDAASKHRAAMATIVAGSVKAI